MQRHRFKVKQTQHVDPEWGTLDKINTEYSPLDLYSGDFERMLGALRAIGRNPQNFLQVFVDSGAWV